MNKKFRIFGVGFFTFCLPICASSSLLAAGVNGSGIPGSAEQGSMDGILSYLWAMSDRCVQETESGVIEAAGGKESKSEIKHMWQNWSAPLLLTSL